MRDEQPQRLDPLVLLVEDELGLSKLMVMILEDEARVETLTASLAAVLSDPDRLAAMSAGARSVALPDAAARLADLVEATAGQTASPR